MANEDMGAQAGRKQHERAEAARSVMTVQMKRELSIAHDARVMSVVRHDDDIGAGAPSVAAVGAVARLEIHHAPVAAR